MSRIHWTSLWLVPAIAGATTLAATIVASPAFANPSLQKISDAELGEGQVSPPSASETSSIEQVIIYGENTGETQIGQVTSVSQLTDVRPTDWAFQALQSLVERYGCIVGYPNRTYRGNQALTRYEFAAGLNACLDRVNELIAAGTADLVKKEDLLALQKLQEEFAAELATLRGQVDALEARTATLERQQFSTTTKLVGEVLFTIADTFGDRATRNGNGDFLTGVNAGNEGRFGDETETIFADRVRLNLDSSFTGRDQLRIRLQARNITPFSGPFTGTNMTRLGHDGNNNNQVEASKVFYRFPLSENFRVQIDAFGQEFHNGVISTLSPFTSSGTGALSRFGRFSSIYRSNAVGAGLTFDLKLSDAFSLQGGYSADTQSNDPSPRNGLFDGAFTALGQIVIRPARGLDIGLTYAHSYYPANEVNLTSSIGSAFAANPFDSNATTRRRPTSSDVFGAQLQWRLSPKFIVGGWFSYGFAEQRNADNEAEFMNAAVFLGFPDLGKEGNLGGIIVGLPPKVVKNDLANREDEDTSIHIEGLYRYRLTDNIAITPGVIVILNPEHNNDNDTQFVGVVRTTFSF